MAEVVSHHDDHVRTQHFAIAVYHGSGGKHPRAGRCLWCLSCPLICHLNMAFSSHVNEPSCQWTHGSPVARTLIVTVAVASVIRFFIETSTMLRNLSHFPQSLRTGLAPVKRGCFLRTAAVAALATSRLRVTRGTPVIRCGLITVLISSVSLAHELAYGAGRFREFAYSIAAGRKGVLSSRSASAYDSSVVRVFGSLRERDSVGQRPANSTASSSSVSALAGLRRQTGRVS